MGVTALRGRAHELDSLVQAAENALAGSGTTVLLEGEAGIGKTRLIDEIAARADEVGMRVHRGVAEELEQGRPFGSLIDALGAPDTAPRLGPGAEATRYLVQDAFVDHLERLATSPLLLALDDLQWADRATMAMLWALARRSSDMGLLLVLAFRPTPAPPGLQRLLEGCDRIGALRIRLGPVAAAALDDLALDVLGAPPTPALRAQLQGAAGNPFVAIELLAARSTPDLDPDPDDLADTQLPPALRGALLARFTGLSETARRVLPVAAVLGASACVDDLAALVGITSDEATEVVTEAGDAGLFEPTDGVLTFRHDLIRDALYESLPEAVRISWHREAARILEGGAEPTVVAQHLMLGATRGDADAIDSLRRAAEQLRDETPDVAAALLERALALSHDPASQAELATQRAEALLLAGRAEEAEWQADGALAALAAAPQIRARALFVRAETLGYQGRFGESRDAFGQALSTGALDEDSTAAALGLHAQVLTFTLALDEALETCERAVAEGTRLGAANAVVDALKARCVVHTFRSEFDAAVAAGRQAVALTEADPRVRSDFSLIGLALVGADRADEARTVTENGRRRAMEQGEVVTLSSQQLVLAYIAWASGRWDDAATEIDAMTGLAEDFGLRVGDPMGHAVLGNIAFHRGDLATAQTQLDAGRVVGTRGGMLPRTLLARLSALMLEAEGDTEGALAVLLEALEFGQALGIDTVRSMLGVECVRVAVAAGKSDRAEVIAVDLREFAQRAASPGARGTEAFARGTIDGNGALLGEAAQEFAAAGRPIFRLRALEAAAHAHDASGERDEAVASAQAALVVADELGAVHDGRRITAMLRDLGVRIGAKDQSARATHGWESLTGAERDVAQLVGEGLRNREIADRLFISRRTVETHVSRLYTKLGVQNRVSLAQLIREQETGVTSPVTVEEAP